MGKRVKCKKGDVWLAKDKCFFNRLYRPGERGDFEPGDEVPVSMFTLEGSDEAEVQAEKKAEKPKDDKPKDEKKAEKKAEKKDEPKGAAVTDKNVDKLMKEAGIEADERDNVLKCIETLAGANGKDPGDTLNDLLQKPGEFAKSYAAFAGK